MFKTHKDFAKIDPRHASHPGTPVRLDPEEEFDIWQDREGRLFLIKEDGSRVHFDSADDAQRHADEAIGAGERAAAAARQPQQPKGK